jgi:hypothetical protein
VPKQDQGRRDEHCYQQLDVLRLLRQEVRRDLLAESKKHKAWKLLLQDSGDRSDPNGSVDRAVADTAPLSQ